MKEKHYFCNLNELSKDKFLIKTLKNMEIGGIICENSYTFLLNICSHSGAPICKGRVEKIYKDENCRLAIKCPWHGWMFYLDNGSGAIPQIKQNLKTFDFEIIDQGVFLHL